MVERLLLRAVHVDIKKAHRKLTRIIKSVAALVEAHLICSDKLVVLRLVHARSLERVIDIFLLFIGHHPLQIILRSS